MATYGYVRHLLLRRERLAEGQIAEMAQKAKELGGSLRGVFVDPGSPGDKTAILSRPEGKRMLETLRAGDTLIVNRLDRLGCSMQDVNKTVEVLAEREVRIYVLDAWHGELDLPPGTAKAFLELFAWLAKTEGCLRSERLTEAAQQRRDKGLAYCNPPTGQKIVQRAGVKVLEWDMEQLGYIAEIAKRLPREGPEKVAEDFWRRRVKDRRGRPWGQQTPRPKPIGAAILQLLARGRPSHRIPYQQFYRAARWFHRMKWKGLLPPPYCELAVQEPKGYCEKPKPKKWTRGGTKRREQERAESKARHCAERAARWQREKAARLQSRVHKPIL